MGRIIDENLTYARRRENQKALRKYIAGSAANVFLTANFNIHGMSLDNAEKSLRFYWKAMNREILGPRWSGFQMKLTGVAVPEHMLTNLHYHIAVTVPEPDRLPRFLEIAQPLFRTKVAPAGEMHSELIKTPDERVKVASYIAKKAFEREAVEGWLPLG